MNRQDLLELALLDELRTMKRVKLLEGELFEQFDYAFNYVMKLAEKNELALPNHKAMLSCLRRIDTLMNQLNPSPETGHPRRYPEDGTEPVNDIWRAEIHLVPSGRYG